MNNLSIPNEVAGFFAKGSGKTLLVKGNPGSGKTIFALTLLQALGRKGVYLSTRVDTESLYGHIGWLRENLPAENIIDATQSERQRATSTSLIKPLKYTNVPDFLKGVYERTEKLKSALVIIDSWDAIVSHTGFHEPRERERLEHNLCDFSRKTTTDIIFIVEYVEQKPLDYLTDGVVTTISSVHDMRRIRTLELQKLRGRLIKQPTYLYSLHGGIFRVFPVFKRYPLDNLKMPPPLPDISPERLSTGIKDLDIIVNGYGSFNLCCGDRMCYDLLQLFLILNSLGLGKRLALTLSEQSILKNAAGFLPEDLGDKIQMLPTESIDTLKKRVSDLNRQKLMAGAIFFLCLDDRTDHGVERLIFEITQKGGFVFGFVSEGKAIDADLESMASTSLVTKMHFGVPCVYSNLPVTELYAITLETAGGWPELSLTPIV